MDNFACPVATLILFYPMQSSALSFLFPLTLTLTLI